MRRHIWSIRPKQKWHSLLTHSQNEKAAQVAAKEAVSGLAAKLNDFLAQATAEVSSGQVQTATESIQELTESVQAPATEQD
ncbi:hypothetical protein [Paenibacillus polymyxa]|uniref:hypothetical protein n=1 Tax=Paenibacillus polymyxa TaxID=1406 RepID=UPI00287F8D80|nr:hypothetical protein [Paenibacillus polymyxa]